MNFCTIFDSNYIDRALVMYESLVEVCKDAVLYVVAFDDACYKALSSLSYDRMIIIPYEDFEDDELRTAKGNRSPREFLWTCSGYSIKYIIKRYKLADCTYIDADLYFYSSPEAAVNAFLQSDNDVAIISHRFSDHPENRYNAKMFGEYCVEFNSFKNTPNGMGILDWWISKCLVSCPEKATEDAFGDQKYLNELPAIFGGVYIYEDFGLGIAPWNVDEYCKTGEFVTNTRTKEKGRVVFYHFHMLDIFPEEGSNIRVFIRPGRHDEELIRFLYLPYIKRIRAKRSELNEKFALFCPNELDKGAKIHKGELVMFLTCEPNIVFLLKKMWRYLLYKKKDYIEEKRA